MDNTVGDYDKILSLYHIKTIKSGLNEYKKLDHYHHSIHSATNIHQKIQQLSPNVLCSWCLDKYWASFKSIRDIHRTDSQNQKQLVERQKLVLWNWLMAIASLASLCIFFHIATAPLEKETARIILVKSTSNQIQWNGMKQERYLLSVNE
jgi:hypothetical protein